MSAWPVGGKSVGVQSVEEGEHTRGEETEEERVADEDTLFI